jgi:DNA gyrase subunit A
MITALGKAMRFDESDVRRMGRTATGVRGIRLSGDDKVRSLDVVDNEATLVIATENGYGKRTEFSGFTPHKRGGKGMIAIKDDDGRNGLVVAAHAVKDGQSIIMITSKGMMVRSPIDGISLVGRAAKGVRLVRLDKGYTLVSVSTVAAEEEVEVPDTEDANATEGTDAPAEDAVVVDPAAQGEAAPVVATEESEDADDSDTPKDEA